METLKYTGSYSLDGMIWVESTMAFTGQVTYVLFLSWFSYIMSGVHSLSVCLSLSLSFFLSSDSVSLSLSHIYSPSLLFVICWFKNNIRPDLIICRWTNDTTTVLARRERPQILLSPSQTRACAADVKLFRRHERTNTSTGTNRTNAPPTVTSSCSSSYGRIAVIYSSAQPCIPHQDAGQACRSFTMVQPVGTQAH